MYETLHINQRARQRGITKRMIELTLEYGEVQADKVKLGTKRIKKLLQNRKQITTRLKKGYVENP